MNTFHSLITITYDTIIAMVSGSIRAYVYADASIQHTNENGLKNTYDETHLSVIGEKISDSTSSDTDVVNAVVMYVRMVSAPLYYTATIAPDSYQVRISYGEPVRVYESCEKFFKVTWNTYTGYILKDDVAESAREVYPQFEIGKENTVDDVNTVRVRTIIQDTFGLSRSEFPLQAGEYVLYKLWRSNIRMSWPTTQPRIPGQWHTLLKGTSSVHMGVTPKMHAIMEYVDDNEIGYLAYVEAVFPDNTIVLSEANYPDRGIYNERTLSFKEWRELRPVFVSF